MKTLGKLQINQQKMLTNDELKNLKGGWDGFCAIYYYGDYEEVEYMSNLNGDDPGSIDAHCAELHGGYPYSCFCNFY